MALCVTVGVVFFPASVIVPFAVSGGVGSYLYAQDMLGGIKPDSKDKLFTLRNIGVALAAIPLGAAIAGLSFLTLPVTLPASIFYGF